MPIRFSWTKLSHNVPMEFALQLYVNDELHKEIQVRNAVELPREGETIFTTKDIEGESPTSKWTVRSVNHTISTPGTAVVIIAEPHSGLNSAAAGSARAAVEK